MTMISPIPGTMLVKETTPSRIALQGDAVTYHAVARQGDAQGRHLGVELSEYLVDGNEVDHWGYREFPTSRFEVVG